MVRHNLNRDKYKEHMSIVINQTDFNIFIMHFCVLFIAFLFASHRKELTPLSFIFIVLFPYAYITYVVIDLFMHSR